MLVWPRWPLLWCMSRTQTFSAIVSSPKQLILYISIHCRWISMDFYGMLMSFVAEAETWKTLAQTFPAGISMVSTCHASISRFSISKGMPMRKLPPSGPLDKKGTSANKDRFAVMPCVAMCSIGPKISNHLDRRYQTISNLHSFPDRTFPSNICQILPIQTALGS